MKESGSVVKSTSIIMEFNIESNMGSNAGPFGALTTGSIDRSAIGSIERSTIGSIIRSIMGGSNIGGSGIEESEPPSGCKSNPPKFNHGYGPSDIDISPSLTPSADSYMCL